MMLEEDYLQLSGIQHFAFCRRQWALIHIEGLWSENELTVGGELIHERAHDKMQAESRGEEITVRGMPVKSARLGISGECDAVVFTKNDNGVYLHGKKGLWSAMPVEYKHGKSKINDCDRLQVTAQAICLEEMLCCTINKAAVYYHETRSREYVDITSVLRVTAEKMFLEMHELMTRNYTPKVKPEAKCSRCSLSSLCLPKLLKKKNTAISYIEKHMEEREL